MVVNGFFHELVDLLWDFLSRVEESLLLIVLPVQGQIQNTYGLPEIAQLGASTVDNSSYLIGDYELEILYK